MFTNRISQERDRKLTMAAQDQTLAIKAYRVTILKQQDSMKCRMCTGRDETVMRNLSECLNLVDTVYKKRHV